MDFTEGISLILSEGFLCTIALFKEEISVSFPSAGMDGLRARVDSASGKG